MKANAQTITINTKVGDDIEEVATYINGQTELVSASVDGEGKLQIFAGTDKVQGDVTFSGGLAGDLNMGPREAVTVDTIDVTTVGGAQAISRDCRLSTKICRQSPRRTWCFPKPIHSCNY